VPVQFYRTTVPLNQKSRFAHIRGFELLGCLVYSHATTKAELSEPDWSPLSLSGPRIHWAPAFGCCFNMLLSPNDRARCPWVDKGDRTPIHRRTWARSAARSIGYYIMAFAFYSHVHTSLHHLLDLLPPVFSHQSKAADEPSPKHGAALFFDGFYSRLAITAVHNHCNHLLA